MKKKFIKIISKYKSVDFVIKDEFKYYYSDVLQLMGKAYKLGKKKGQKNGKRFFFISDSPIKVTKIPEPPKDIIGNYHKTPWSNENEI